MGSVGKIAISLFMCCGLISAHAAEKSAVAKKKAAQGKKVHLPIDQPAPIAPAPQAVVPPPAPLRPAQMSAIAPRVSFQNGLLTVFAENSSFSDVLNAIRAATGVRIESSGGMGGDRIAAQIGPAPVRDVLLTLFQGSRYDFIMLGSNTDPNKLERVVLTPKSASAGPTVAANNRAPAAPANADAEGDDSGDSAASDDNEGFAQPAPQPQPNAAQPGAPGAAVPGAAGAAVPDASQQNGVKTPEQLLQDLRNMEQQKQLQQQQTTPQGPASPDVPRSTRPPRG
ncbi:MAG: hypothetical protein JWO13_2911 [Acidobacteriales bacterium]|nr:hypothetical protein [Terriglobales bacterium]